MWGYYKSNFENRTTRVLGPSAQNFTETINVFSALFAWCEELFTLRENQILCKYQHLITWRKLSTFIGDDILVAAYMAGRSNYGRIEGLGFDWEVATKHNNSRLYLLLNKGISENHFHFWGSTPIFQLSWISLMNDICDSKMLNYVSEYDNDRQYTNIKYGLNYEEESLSIQYLQAAYIRVLLFSYLTDTKLNIGSYYVKYNEYAELIHLGIEKE